LSRRDENNPAHDLKELPMKRKLSAKSLAITGVALAYCVPADAADLGVRPAAAPPPAPVYSWNGFYVGANFGGVFTIERETIGSAFLGNPATFSSNPSGVLGGGQVGYNFQLSPNWLIGVEGEFDGTSAQGVGNINTQMVAPRAGQNGSLTSNHNWYGTADGRLGYIMGLLLLYGKGGAAWMNADYSFSAVGNINGVSSVNATRSGWTVGGGIEAFIMPNWSAKLEYDYLDFGTVSYAFPITGSAVSFRTETHEVKLGVNYHW
jgi:opacity protein-like surface antigen